MHKGVWYGIRSGLTMFLPTWMEKELLVSGNPLMWPRSVKLFLNLELEITF